MGVSNQEIRVAAILGSIRPGNFTAKALGLVVDELKKYKDIHIDVIDPAELQLTMPGEESGDSAQQLQQMVSQATGVILSTPEYHGSYSSTIKLVIDNLGFPSVLAEKPVALLGVAAGQIGAVKALEHLRSVCSHVGSLVLPGPVSVAGVHHLFDEEGCCLDPKVEKRIRGLATTLMAYIQKHICPHVALEETVREDEG